MKWLVRNVDGNDRLRRRIKVIEIDLNIILACSQFNPCQTLGRKAFVVWLNHKYGVGLW